MSESETIAVVGSISTDAGDRRTEVSVVRYERAVRVRIAVHRAGLPSHWVHLPAHIAAEIAPLVAAAAERARRDGDR